MMNSSKKATSNVSIWWILFGTVFLLFLTRLYGSIFFRTEYYFSFLDIATSSNRDISILGFILKLVLPIATGFVIGYLSKSDFLKEAFITGFLTSLLLSWPVLYFPVVRSRLLPVELEDKPVLIFVIYGLFILSYSYLCELGASSHLVHRRLKRSQRLRGISKLINPKDAIRAIVLAVIASLVWHIVLNLSK